MTRILNIQTNFTVGEVDPLLRGRIDLNQYYSALKTAENVVVIPQGGVRRRPGLKFIYDLPASAANGVSLVPFEFSVADSYMFAIVNQRIYIFKNGVLITNINGSGNAYLAASTLTSAILPNLKYAQSADTMIFVHEDLEPLKLVRGANDSSWTLSAIAFTYKPHYAFSITTSSPSTTLTASASTGFIELTCAGGTFASTDVEQYINIKDGYGYGRARIVTYVSTTKVKAVVEIPFSQTSAYASGEWEIERGYEHVWSSTKGWPRSVTFHEGRLFFGGSKSRPSTIWGSRVGDVFNFDKQQSNDDDGLEATLDVDQFNAVIDIYSGRDLQIFTTGAEFYVPQGLGDPLTPTAFVVRVATRNGMLEGVPPVGLEAGTLYVQRGGKTVKEFIYTDAQATYISNNISVLSGHLINTPIDLALRRATDTDEADLLMLVNNDGSFTAYSVLRSQDIIAPSRFTTDGLFKAVAVDVDTIYVVVQRTINGSTKYHVEQFDRSITLDNAVSGGAAASVTASNLAAKTVKVIADGVLLSNETASSVGLITFDRSSSTSFTVGVDYTVTVATMPLEPRLNTGNLRGFRKRIIEVAAEFYETQNASIGGVEIPFRTFDTNVLDSPVDEFTGLKRVGPLLGYDYEGSVTVTQTAPLKMTLLFLDYRVSVPMGQ
ncbi:MAG: hypothetical protein LW635_00115 [Microcystis sp. 53598_E5]|nr:hypothetical protein [Microcystis sp. 53598_E5]